MYAMHFPNDQVQIEIANNLGIEQMIEASDGNYVISRAGEIGVPSLLLEFHEDAHKNENFVATLGEYINQLTATKTPWPGD